DRLDRGEGTLGKLAKDEMLYNDLRAGVTKFNTLIDSIQNGEGTVGKFIKDPSLFNNVNQVTSELEKLMYDFSQNPKKFLTVNFKLFYEVHECRHQEKAGRINSSTGKRTPRGIAKSVENRGSAGRSQ